MAKKRFVCCKCKSWDLAYRGRIPEGWSMIVTPTKPAFEPWVSGEFKLQIEPTIERRPICPKCKPKGKT